MTAEQKIEALREALKWALANVDQPREVDGEVWDDWTGACRLAWPDNPEEWD